MKSLYIASCLLITTSLGGCLKIDAKFNLTTASHDNLIAADDRLNATYWLQKSAEYKGAANQAYATARRQLNAALADPSWSAALEQTGSDFSALPPAIILDVDETVLDNTALNVWLAKTGKPFASRDWDLFVESASSPATPGALALTNYAAEKGVQVFYVTNRKAHLEAATRRNLESEGFPLASNEDVLLMKGERPEWTSEKGSRRAVVAASYRILLLVGDNLGDFADGILSTPKDRHAIVDANVDRFGKSWIILPNPVYGSWENAAFGFNFDLSLDERRQVIASGMDEWAPE